MDDLQQVVFGVFEDHEDAFRLEDDFYEVNEGWMAEFGAKGHFPDRRLRDAGVLEFAFLVWFEFLDGEGVDCAAGCGVLGCLCGGGTFRGGFVDSPVGSAANETYNVVVVVDVALGGVGCCVHFD